MRFTQHYCPECGDIAMGVLEAVYCWAQLDDTGAYNGATDVCWDDQTVVSDDKMHVTLTDGTHEWKSRVCGEERFAVVNVVGEMLETCDAPPDNDEWRERLNYLDSGDCQSTRKVQR